MTIYVGIVGSRHRYGEKLERRIRSILRVHNSTNTVIISGGAKGVDTIAIRIAKSMGFKTEEYEPKYEEYKTKFNKIYYERNLKIIQKCDRLYAFPLNNSRGTTMTIDLFKAKTDYSSRHLIIYNSRSIDG